jgi:N6-L-threonylcarbamoyladenine synthase
MTRILAIETSCDETAAAVVADRCHVLSNVVASQVDVHRKYGGVVPELASRHHVEAIGPIVTEALERAGVGLDGVDAVAVTCGPGLVGSLLVGLCAGKAMAWHRGLPLLGVNHLEGHIRSPFLEHPEIELPAVALVVSGGHTSLYLCPDEGIYRLLARTRDDAAGEAFDKVAKLLGLGYPGGPVIDRLSEGADEAAVRFPKAVMKDHSLDFSFSGLKTAVRRRAQAEGLAHGAAVGGEASPRVRDLVASFQKAVVDALVDTTIRACRKEAIRTILLAGGVACNRRLRRAFGEAAVEHGLKVYMPSPVYTTDNAAMIAAAAFLHLERGQIASMALNADANLRL